MSKAHRSRRWRKLTINSSSESKCTASGRLWSPARRAAHLPSVFLAEKAYQGVWPDHTHISHRLRANLTMVSSFKHFFADCFADAAGNQNQRVLFFSNLHTLALEL